MRMSKVVLGLMCALVSNISAQSEPKALQSLMAEEAVRISRPIIAAIPPTFDIEAHHRSLDRLLQALKPARVEDSGQNRLFVYNSDWMLPESPATTMGPSATAVSDALLKCLKNSFGSVDAALEGGVNGSDILPSDWERLGNALAPSFGNVGEQMREGKGTLSLSLQRGFRVFDADGNYLAEVGWMQPCADGLDNLRGLFGGQMPVDPQRCPSELENAVEEGPVRSIMGVGVPILKVSELIGELAPSVAYPIICDRRVEDLRLAFSRSGPPLTRRQLIRIIPEALDMYWRKVGVVWLLAASPDHPALEASRRASTQVNKGMTAIGDMMAKGKEDFDLIGSRELSLGTLSERQRQAFADLVFKCATPESRETIQGLVQSGKLGPGTKLRSYLMIHYSIRIDGTVWSSYIGG